MKASDRNHPADDRLIALYFGDEGSMETRKHLHGCESCTWRYTELTAPLQMLRQDAVSEADEVFGETRLAAQRDAIGRRLDEGTRGGRVVPFPGAAQRQERSLVSRPIARWIAAAAAAGLIIGLSVGRLAMPGGSSPSYAPRTAHVVPSPASSGVQVRPTVYTPSDAASDEAFLTAVDLAAARQRIAALSALDAMTPHAREAVLARR